MDRLVVFTSHYPYGNGEPFLEDELKVAESCFSKIVIVTYAKHNEELTRYIPGNATVIHLRKDSKKTGKFSEALGLLKNIFRFMTWKEICNGIRERGFNKLSTIVKTILLFERHIDCIKKNESMWMNSNSPATVFYSYWLNSAAVYLSQYHHKFNGICICRAHGGDCFFDREYVPWRKNVIDRLDKVFSISSGGKNDLILHYKKHVNNIENKIGIARLGVKLPETVNTASASEERIIVSCSNVIPLKRLDLLIYALADKSIKDHIKWVHFGDGPQLGEISALANQCLGNSDHVTYELKGRTPRNEILDYYKENVVALFINCSDVEGIPVSIMEAMSYGIPAIARNVGCNGELVNDTCGALLPNKITSEELAITITSLLEENEIVFEQKRKAAMEMVSGNYHFEKNYKIFFDEIETMLREKADE